jgi:hypothetical protein
MQLLDYAQVAITKFFKPTQKAFQGFSRLPGRYVRYTPPREITPSVIKKYFRTIFVLRRVITDLTKAIITKSNAPEYDSLASKVCLNLLLFSYVIVEKKTGRILDPEFTEFYTTSRVDPKLIAIMYRDELSSPLMLMDEVAVMTLDTIAGFNPVSPLDSISYELKAFEESRELMVNHFEQGAHTKLAMILDSEGLNLAQMKAERESITATMVGVENAGAPFVGFSKGAKGQIIELQNNFVSDSHIAFFEYITTAIATACGVPSDYVNQAQKGSGLSDSRHKITDYVYNQTIIGLQRTVEDFMTLLDIDYKLERPLTEAQQLLLDNKSQTVDTLKG